MAFLPAFIVWSAVNQFASLLASINHGVDWYGLVAGHVARQSVYSLLMAIANCSSETLSVCLRHETGQEWLKLSADTSISGK